MVGAQFRILLGFRESDSRGFVELCTGAGYPTDLGGYYLRQLVRSGYVTKLERGVYGVTPKGKRELAVSHGQHMAIARPRTVVLIVIEYEDSVVFVRRAVQPFIGVAEWLAGSVYQGEPFDVSAKRLLQERLQLEAQPQFVGLLRRIDHYQDAIFDDKLFAVYRLRLDTLDQLPIETPTGTLTTCPLDKINAVTRPAKSLLDILAFSRLSQPPYEEHAYTLTREDLGQ